MSVVETERQRRLDLWQQIAQEQDLNSIEPQQLRAIGNLWWCTRHLGR
jgi:hypothetical protein